ncbi:MAG: hypothetical protein H0V89_03605 [Deltaproteobacteria bacterium]|nr:hypothetical protein [Deltaproteobacteria bacterium]
MLSRFDGRTPWRTVLRATEETIGEPISEDLVLTLWRRGLLTDPAELDAAPGWKIRLVNVPATSDGQRWETEVSGPAVRAPAG